VIPWNKLRNWELKKATSPDSEKWFSILILKIYPKESLLPIESLLIRESLLKKLYQMGPEYGTTLGVEVIGTGRRRV
jgi:hypothetical protein